MLRSPMNPEHFILYPGRLRLHKAARGLCNIRQPFSEWSEARSRCPGPTIELFLPYRDASLSHSWYFNLQLIFQPVTQLNMTCTVSGLNDTLRAMTPTTSQRTDPLSNVPTGSSSRSCSPGVPILQQLWILGSLYFCYIKVFSPTFTHWGQSNFTTDTSYVTLAKLSNSLRLIFFSVKLRIFSTTED